MFFSANKSKTCRTSWKWVHIEIFQHPQQYTADQCIYITLHMYLTLYLIFIFSLIFIAVIKKLGRMFFFFHILPLFSVDTLEASVGSFTKIDPPDGYFVNQNQAQHCIIFVYTLLVHKSIPALNRRTITSHFYQCTILSVSTRCSNHC